MTSKNKLLTISYGNFSCSLDGFDETFEILQPIAEYFRDLENDAQNSATKVANPDAGALAKIAGRGDASAVATDEDEGVIRLSVVTLDADDIPLMLSEDAIVETGSDAQQTDSTGTGEEDGTEETHDTGESPDPLLLTARVIKVNQNDFEDAIDAGLLEEEEAVAEVVEDDESNIVDSAESQGDQMPSDTDEKAKADAEGDDTQDIDDVAAQDANDDDTAMSDDGDDHVSDPDASDPQDNESKDSDLVDIEEGLVVAKRPVIRKGIDRLESAERRSDIERIFDQTNSHLGAPDASKRRSAIQQLRAAVAATRADKLAGAKPETNIDETPYRTDFADAVKSAPDGTGRRNKTSLPPLKLMTDQRSDHSS